MKRHWIHFCSALARAVRAHPEWTLSDPERKSQRESQQRRVVSFALLLVLGLVTLLPGSAYAADGTLDTSFGNPNVDSQVNALALQSDGKVLIGGGFTSVGGTMMRRVARLNSDGTLDTSFGDPNVNNWVWALALQPDGKVLIGGDFTSVGGQARSRVARLNSDGALDTSFGDPNVNGIVDALALQSDGKVLIGGWFTSVGGQTRYRVARLNASEATRLYLPLILRNQ